MHVSPLAQPPGVEKNLHTSSVTLGLGPRLLAPDEVAVVVRAPPNTLGALVVFGAPPNNEPVDAAVEAIPPKTF